MTDLIKKYKPSLQLPMILLLSVWVLYAMLSVIAPANQAISKYGITLTQGNLLRATVLIPSLIIWVAAFLAVTRFKRYATLVKDTPDGAGFAKFGYGLLLLFMVLLLPSFINVVGSFYPESEIVQKIVVITRNYVQLGLYFGAFWLFLLGAKRLNETLSPVTKPLRLFVYRVIAVKMVALSTAYVWAVFHNDFRTATINPLIRPTYYLPDWLIVLTIVIPYLIVWLMGSLAVAEIWLYAKRVPGKVYRKAFTYITFGLTFLIGLLITLQLLSQAASALNSASLKIILAIIYLLLLVIALAYFFLAKGARALTAIEEV